MRRAGVYAAMFALALSACGGIVEVPSTKAEGTGGSGGEAPEVAPPPPSWCRQITTKDECCAAAKGTACMWFDPKGDFQGGCISDEEDCGQPLNVCPPGQRCYAQELHGAKADCYSPNYSMGLYGMCIDE